MPPYGFIGPPDPAEEQDPYLAELESLQQEEFQPGQFRGSFLEPFAGLEQQQFRQPRSFSEGLVYGLSSGLGRAGTQAQQARHKFEQSEASRRAAFDAERRAASRELRQLKGTALRDEIKARRDAEKAKEAYNLSHPQLTAAHVVLHPELGRLPLGTRVPEDWLKPTKAEKPDRPMLIEGPNGPVYVTPSQALGKAPPKKEALAKPATGAERQTLAFYNRAKDSAETILAPTRRGNTLDSEIGLSNISQTKIAAARFNPLMNAALSPEEQVYLQAQRQFTEARLRKESGAAISPSEYENDAKTYFAQPGDKPAAIERKRKAREKVLEGLRFGAGKAYDEFYRGVIPSESGGNADIDAEYEQYLRSQR